jgi:cytochrome d ubiquinol oxidase subunit I
MVALGSMFSAVWIVVANSWQQTPAGHHIVQMVRDGKPWFDENGVPIMRAEVLDFWGVVFNPSSADRLIHTLIGSFIMGAFFVMSISAYYLLKKRHEEFARRSFSGALIFATVFSLAQLVSGDSNAKMVARHQPAKLAAFEGQFHSGRGDLSLFGWPDEQSETVHFNVAIPGLLGYLTQGDAETHVTGLDRVPREYWPPVLAAFLSYHTMVGIGMFFIALTLLASFFRWRGTLFRKRWLLWTFVFSVVLAEAANQLGWMAAEVGRQPWVVHPRVERDAAGGFALGPDGMLQHRLDEGLLTNKAVSEAVVAEQVVASIVMFGLIYLLLGAVWVMVLHHKIQKGPEAVRPTEPTSLPGLAAVAAMRPGHQGSLGEARDEASEPE